MTRKIKWEDEYWLPLIQLYLRKPVGVKPIYSKGMVNLALELHIPPRTLYEKMFLLRRLATPRIERLWNNYGNNPQKLAKGVRLWRKMRGFNNPTDFYEGVEVNESWEKDFKPIAGLEPLTPVMLILILDQYFRLTPVTMNTDTPEVKHLAQRMKIPASMVVQVMKTYQYCDPYLNRQQPEPSPLLAACEEIWKRFVNDSAEKLATTASLLGQMF